MHKGQGTLIFRNGLRLPATYQFGSNYDDRRAGYLLCDTSQIDPAALCDRLHVICEDGTDVIVLVLHSNDQHLGVIGRDYPIRRIASAENAAGPTAEASGLLPLQKGPNRPLAKVLSAPKFSGAVSNGAGA